jgi:predicted nucleic acid-binding protein
MLVLVDTPIWSLALRRTSTDLNPRERHLTKALRELIRDGRAQLVGPIRQELLSGIRPGTSFRRLRDQMRAFDDAHLELADYEEAAHIHNQCRSRGIAGSAIDFLVCAAAFRRDWQIFTTDRDFTRYATVMPLKLYQASESSSLD